VEVAHAQTAEPLAPQPVVQKRRQNGPVALALERVGRRCLEQRPGLAVTQRRDLALNIARFSNLRFEVQCDT
jgi:hypothetical protein